MCWAGTDHSQEWIEATFCILMCMVSSLFMMFHAIICNITINVNLRSFLSYNSACMHGSVSLCYIHYIYYITIVIIKEYCSVSLQQVCIFAQSAPHT